MSPQGQICIPVLVVIFFIDFSRSRTLVILQPAIPKTVKIAFSVFIMFPASWYIAEISPPLLRTLSLISQSWDLHCINSVCGHECSCSEHRLAR